MIWAVGRNYANHAKEMKAEVPIEPIIFSKSDRCLIVEKPQINIPSWSIEMHFETELLLQLGDNLTPSKMAIGLDLTERHFQSIAKQKGTPWEIAKGFTGACPSSKFIAVPKEIDWSLASSVSDLSFELEINGQIRQSTNLSQLIFNVPTLIEYLKSHFPIESGDYLLTGTPEGVGALKSGDKLFAHLDYAAQFKNTNRLIEQHWTVC